LKPEVIADFWEQGKRIQPTYEELKRHNAGRPRWADGRIQPTYEELKHAVLPYHGEAGEGIQPTYEELKRTGKHAYCPGKMLYPAYL